AEAFEVRLRSEGGRLNINTLLAKKDRLLLEGVFIFWGLSEEEASEIMDALLDWVDSDDLEELTGAEFEYYYELGYENYPFNRPFYDIEEMALVRGMDLVSEYKPDWRDYFTLWSSGSINVNEASAEMLEMVGEVSPEAAGQFVRVRNGLDLYPDTEDDVVYQNVAEAVAVLGIPELSPAIGRFSVSDATMRVESTGIVGDYLKTVVLVVRNRDTRPEILARDELFYR
ncbi:MAG: general secretion pathway protein GspK, partial [Verrucomicrobiales bacterium]